MSSTLLTDSLPIEIKSLHMPSLDEIQKVLSNDLKTNFSDVTVEVVECPNLQNAPFHLAGKGISGSTQVIDIGGPPYLLPLVDRSRLYNLKEICQKLAPSGTNVLAIGAGAGPHPIVNTNCEGIYNLSLTADGNTKGSNSHLVRVNQISGNEEFITEIIPENETRLALLGNIFQSEGKTGQVLHVHCKIRTGPTNFITAIRKSLANYYKDKPVGLGGVFVVKNGKVKQHVMRDFSKAPITSEKELNEWLKFYEMPAPLIAVGTLVSHDEDLDLRVEHFHSFSNHGCGGHYHYDTTPEIAEYDGYFNVGEKIVRIDRPVNTHQIGRD